MATNWLYTFNAGRVEATGSTRAVLIFAQATLHIVTWILGIGYRTSPASSHTQFSTQDGLQKTWIVHCWESDLQHVYQDCLKIEWRKGRPIEFCTAKGYRSMHYPLAMGMYYNILKQEAGLQDHLFYKNPMIWSVQHFLISLALDIFDIDGYWGKKMKKTRHRLHRRCLFASLVTPTTPPGVLLCQHFRNAVPCGALHGETTTQSPEILWRMHGPMEHLCKLST